MSRLTHIRWGLMVMLAATQANLFAQYQGGSGDGFDHSATIQLDLSGIPLGVRPLYAGGSGDGFDRILATQGLEGTNLASIFGGGTGDGHDHQAKTQTLGGTNLSQLFQGGTGDGFDQLSSQVTLDGAELAAIFGGGTGDGFDRHTAQMVLDGTLLTGLYHGGTGDGFDGHIFMGGLMGEMLALYHGGDGDGFDRSNAQFSLAGQSLAGLFSGGEGDGFDVELYQGVVPLPLTLISFDAIPEATFVLLKWETEDELDTDFFTIEKTRDGSSYDWVGETEAAGFSEPGERLHYELKDQRPWAGSSFYRLKTTDFDGAISLSHLIEVQYQSPEVAHDFDLFPNPNTGQHFSLRLHGFSNDQLCYFEVLSMHGQTISQGQFYPVEEQEQRFELPNTLSSGSYLIRVRSEDGKVNSKILLVK